MPWDGFVTDLASRVINLQRFGNRAQKRISIAFKSSGVMQNVRLLSYSISHYGILGMKACISGGLN